MANRIYRFKCRNPACDCSENSVELPEGDPATTKYLLYCSACGWVVEAKSDATVDKAGREQLSDILFEGTEMKLTLGPVSDGNGRYKWGDPSGSANLTEEEFMIRYGINPRIEWCKRKSRESPVYKEVCRDMRNSKPIVFRIK